MIRSAVEVTTASFSDRVLNAQQPVLVEFGADWCPPCKMLAPTIQYLAQKYDGQLVVAEVDADADPELVQRYGVMGLPTLIIFRGGQPVQRIVGFQPRERVEAQVVAAIQSSAS